MQAERSMGRAGAAFFALGLAMAAGCAGRQVAGPVAEKAPDWVNKGNGAFKDAGVNVFYGVGIAQGIRNRALSVQASDDRARSEIGKIMETYTSSLGKSYMASTTAGAMDKSSEEQHVTSTLKNFSKTTLRGVIIVEHWKDPSDGTMFALAKLDLAAIRKALEDSKELDSKMRDFVRANAEKSFDELAAEEAKH